MALLDTLKKVKNEIVTKVHPLAELPLVSREWYLTGLGMLALEDDGKLSPREKQTLETYHIMMRMPDGALSGTLNRLTQVDESSIRQLITAFRDARCRFVFILDLYAMAHCDGEIVEKEFEFIQVLADLLNITEVERTLLGQFAEAAKSGDLRSGRSLMEQARTSLFRLSPEEFFHFFPKGQVSDPLRLPRNPEIYVRLEAEYPGTRAFAFSPEADQLAGASAKNQIQIRKAGGADDRILGKLDGHAAQPTALAICPYGNTLASGGADPHIILWDTKRYVETGKLKGHGALVNALAFSPDGRLLASGSNDKSVRLWDVETRRELQCLQVHEGPITSVVFSPDGTLLAAGSADTRISLWNLRDGFRYTRLEGHSRSVNAVAFSPDNRQLVSGGNDNSLKFWEIGNPRPSKEIDHTDLVQSLGYAPDGRTLATTGTDGRVLLWNPRTFEKIYEFFCFLNRFPNFELKTQSVLHLGFAPFGNLMGAASNSRIALWKIAWV